MEEDWTETDDLFTTTPAPITDQDVELVGATTLPPALRAVDPRSLSLTSETVQTSTAADFVGPQQNLDETDATEWDGPAPTGKGISDLFESIGAPSSMSQLFEEMQGAVLGITSDLVGGNSERESITDILTHGTRLRGIGAMLVLIAVVGLALDAFAETQNTTSAITKLIEGMKA